MKASRTSLTALAKYYESYLIIVVPGTPGRRSLFVTSLQVHTMANVFSVRRCLVYENITGYLKNHCTKNMHVYTHFDVFLIVIQNMGTIFNNFDFFKIFLKE